MLSGVGLKFWVRRIGILSCWDNSFRCINGSVRSCGISWWYMKKMCNVLGLILGVLGCVNAVGSR